MNGTAFSGMICGLDSKKAEADFYYTEHPPGLGNPFRISRPPCDTSPTIRLNRGLAFVQARNGFIAAVMPSSSFTRSWRSKCPKKVSSEERR
jgi:hypothetical protein